MDIIREIKSKYTIKSSTDAYRFLKEFRNQDREMFIVLGLDTKNSPVYREICSVGILNQCLVHPREIFKKAIIMSCNSIIIAHNHPSNNLKPSDDDDKTTKFLVEAGELLQIKVVDHLIITNKGHYSYAENNKL